MQTRAAHLFWAPYVTDCSCRSPRTFLCFPCGTFASISRTDTLHLPVVREPRVGRTVKRRFLFYFTVFLVKNISTLWCPRSPVDSKQHESKLNGKDVSVHANTVYAGVQARLESLLILTIHDGVVSFMLWPSYSLEQDIPKRNKQVAEWNPELIWKLYHSREPNHNSFNVEPVDWQLPKFRRNLLYPCSG